MLIWYFVQFCAFFLLLLVESNWNMSLNPQWEQYFLIEHFSSSQHQLHQMFVLPNVKQEYLPPSINKQKRTTILSHSENRGLYGKNILLPHFWQMLKLKCWCSAGTLESGLLTAILTVHLCVHLSRSVINATWKSWLDISGSLTADWTQQRQSGGVLFNDKPEVKEKMEEVGEDETACWLR